jgi:hypothetical protein
VKAAGREEKAKGGEPVVPIRGQCYDFFENIFVEKIIEKNGGLDLKLRYLPMQKKVVKTLILRETQIFLQKSFENRQK